MTAEIAVLNKTAVALATDSAITISSGSASFKMFDSGDKLFELCDESPIGIMINNTMDFVGIPLPSLIRTFRGTCNKFEKVEDAGSSFLQFLNSQGAEAPESLRDAYMHDVVQNVCETLKARVEELAKRKQLSFFSERFQPNFDFEKRLGEIYEESWNLQIEVIKKTIDTDKASFVGVDTQPELSPERYATLEALTIDLGIQQPYSKRIVEEIIYPYLVSTSATHRHTGVIVAGFGQKELFPTLVAYRVEGVVFGHLKFVREETIDIDREGRRAAVLPFAQREMVDRFIYGFDDPIQSAIATYCGQNLAQFRDGIAESLDLENADDRAQFEGIWATLQQRFLRSLREDAFEAVRATTQKSVEDMVEFMPKPELARMAEALIEVTSLKRRVTQGMETVAGPIDVAVISQSEGFVWVKRKHYFPSDLNQKHAFRVAEARSRDRA